MGFSSFLCSKTSKSIPAYPYAEKDAELSHIVVIFPDNSKIEGFYDGYMKVHDKPDFQAYCLKGTSSDYHEDQAKAIDLWGILKDKGLLTSKDSFKDLFTKMRIVVKKDYKGESFEDLLTLKDCPAQGYFYDW
jgi:hypothetical protein